MIGAGRLLPRLWALPCTLVGLVAAAPVLLAGGSARRVEGVLEVGLRPLQAGLPRRVRALPFGAITLGHVVIGQSHELLARLRPHEQVHVRQYEQLGALFLLAYPLASLWVWARGGHLYHDNLFERQAEARAHRPAPGAF